MENGALYIQPIQRSEKEMNTKKISSLVVCLVMVIMISVGTVQAYEVPTKTSPADDLALHADTSASDNGWGGG